jgi:CheY-like chemotaxis protein
MEAIGRLAGGVAHDFNNLLSVIISYSGLLASELRPEDPMREDLGEIRKAGERAAALTRQLLAFSRQQVLAPEVIDLNQVVSGMRKMLTSLASEDVQLVIDVDPQLGKVLADPGQVEQVIVNLIVNARDSMPGGGTLTLRTANVELDEAFCREHPGLSPGPHVLLTVKDTGMGMDEATRARAFEPFFTTKEVGKGTGLGLSTVLGIVQQSGGGIALDTRPGEGTTVRIYLPRCAEEHAPAEMADTAPTERHGSETILVVEDEEPVRTLAVTVLRRQGYQVVEARNAEEALRISEQHGGPIHLLLTDVVMPRMSGRHLAERLAPQRPEMKILYISGHTDDAVVQRGVRLAEVSFLQKPLTPENLLRKVGVVLGQPLT